MTKEVATRRLRLLSANIQAGSRTRRYSDYVTRSWSHALPIGGKQGSLDAIAELAGDYHIVGLQEADPGSLRSGFTNQTHYLAQQAGFAYWSHQPNRNVARVAGSANGLLSKREPQHIGFHSLPGRIAGRGVLVANYGDGNDGLVVAVAHLSLGAKSRASQLAFIGDLLAPHRHAVLMGDFNCTHDAPEMQELFKRSHLRPPREAVPTFPSWKPRRAIDHILVGDGLRRGEAIALQAANSDHLALAVDIDVPLPALAAS